MKSEELIRLIDLATIDEKNFKRRFVGCLVLTHHNKILLQQRGSDWESFPDYLATFGGGIDSGETPMQALVRELKEELGAKVNVDDVINLGVITEADTQHSALIYVYFWHDKHHSITGCYEGESKYYDDCAAALSHPKIGEDVCWILRECQKKGLLDDLIAPSSGK